MYPKYRFILFSRSCQEVVKRFWMRECEMVVSGKKLSCFLDKWNKFIQNDCEWKQYLKSPSFNLYILLQLFHNSYLILLLFISCHIHLFNSINLIKINIVYYKLIIVMNRIE